MPTALPLTYLAQAAAAAFIAGLLILMLRRPAERWGLVDHPGGRKRHAAPVPLTGGIAITAGMILALAVSFSAFAQYSAFFAGVLLLALVGLMDDLGEVSPGTKLLLQVIAALLMTSWGENFLVNLGDLFGTNPINTRHWAIPLTVLAALAVVNAINMLDGLDGLAGSLVLGILLVLDRLRLDDRRRERRQDPGRAGRRADGLPVLQPAVAAARSPPHLHGRCGQHGGRLRGRVVFGRADTTRRGPPCRRRSCCGCSGSC